MEDANGTRSVRELVPEATFGEKSGTQSSRYDTACGSTRRNRETYDLAQEEAGPRRFAPPRRGCRGEALLKQARATSPDRNGPQERKPQRARRAAARPATGSHPADYPAYGAPAASSPARNRTGSGHPGREAMTSRSSRPGRPEDLRRPKPDRQVNGRRRSPRRHPDEPSQGQFTFISRGKFSPNHPDRKERSSWSNLVKVSIPILPSSSNQGCRRCCYVKRSHSGSRGSSFRNVERSASLPLGREGNDLRLVGPTGESPPPQDGRPCSTLRRQDHGRRSGRRDHRRRRCRPHRYMPSDSPYQDSPSRRT